MSGLGAIIDGAFKGYAFGEGVKDKKRRREIEDEKLQWDRDDRAHLKTMRGWDAEDRAFEISERNRALDRRQADEAAFSRAFEDAEREHETRSATSPADDPGVVAAPTAPVPPAPSSGGPGLSMRPPASIVSTRNAPAQPPAPSATHEAAPRSMMPPPQPAPGAPASGVPMAFLNDPTVQEKLKQSSIPPERVWQHLSPEVKQKWIDADRTPTAPTSRPAETTAPAQPGVPATDQRPVMPAPSAPPARRGSPTQPVARSEVERTAAAGNEDPNVEAAKAATVLTMQPGTPRRRVNAEVKQRASDSFLDTYQRVAVPQIMEHYLRTGEFDKAKSFETWLKTSEAEKLQREFGNLTFSLAIGDMDGALDHMAGMYANVNDGYTINREQSRFETYDNGQPKRLVVVIEDADGKVFEQVIEDQGDLASQVLGMVNPQAAHEYLLSRNEAAVAARAKSATMVKPIDRKEVTAEVKRIKDDLVEQEGNALLNGQAFEMPTDAEIEQMAIDNLRGRDAAISGAPPSYSAPATPPPDWRPGQ